MINFRETLFGRKQQEEKKAEVPEIVPEAPPPPPSAMSETVVVEESPAVPETTYREEQPPRTSLSEKLAALGIPQDTLAPTRRSPIMVDQVTSPVPSAAERVHQPVAPEDDYDSNLLASSIRRSHGSTYHSVQPEPVTPVIEEPIHSEPTEIEEVNKPGLFATKIVEKKVSSTLGQIRVCRVREDYVEEFEQDLYAVMGEIDNYPGFYVLAEWGTWKPVPGIVDSEMIEILADHPDGMRSQIEVPHDEFNNIVEPEYEDEDDYEIGDLR